MYCSSVLTEASKLPPETTPLKDAWTLVENLLLTELSEFDAQTFCGYCGLSMLVFYKTLFTNHLVSCTIAAIDNDMGPKRGEEATPLPYMLLFRTVEWFRQFINTLFQCGFVEKI